ncbi:MAG TPA: carotenoid 1,2-hydratase [Usitatibacter sp.]|nr:carotenoid 1,2-hydratase [Usitatibacter sp.]
MVPLVSVVYAFEPVTPRELQFPADAGAHPGHRIEWWYVTGHLETADRRPLGFQVTFFRVRNKDAEANPSRFAPKQLLFAHGALSDPALGRLLPAERAARALEGLAEARMGDTDVRIDDWFLRREDGGYRTRIAGDGFRLELTMRPTQAVMLQGERGFSRKGPGRAHASHYYSEPHLAVSGLVARGGRNVEVSGTAWLDHEWSSELLMGEASGWDWLGLNLADGGALMAFRIRDREGRALWSAATSRSPGGEPVSHDPATIEFIPRRTWTSPRTGTRYPVAMEVRVGATTWTVEPLMDDQELDARASSGVLYWEGAVNARSGSAAAGRGYLEFTGYAGRVPF